MSYKRLTSISGLLGLCLISMNRFSYAENHVLRKPYYGDEINKMLIYTNIKNKSINRLLDPNFIILFKDGTYVHNYLFLDETRVGYYFQRNDTLFVKIALSYSEKTINQEPDTTFWETNSYHVPTERVLLIKGDSLIDLTNDYRERYINKKIESLCREFPYLTREEIENYVYRDKSNYYNDTYLLMDSVSHKLYYHKD